MNEPFTVTARSQRELDAAVADYGHLAHVRIVVDSSPFEILRLAKATEAEIHAWGGSVMEVAGTGRLYATDWTITAARGNAAVYAQGQALVLGSGNAAIQVGGSAQARICQNAGAVRTSSGAGVVSDFFASDRLLSADEAPAYVAVGGPVSDGTYLATDTGARWNGHPQLAFDRSEMIRLIASGDGADVEGEGLTRRGDDLVDVSAGDVEPIATTLTTHGSAYVPAGRVWQIEPDEGTRVLPVPAERFAGRIPGDGAYRGPGAPAPLSPDLPTPANPVPGLPGPHVGGVEL